MNNVKLERLNSSIQREVSLILANEMKDRQIQFVTVTAAKTAKDLSSCKVYVTVLDKERKEDTLDSLKNARGFVRSALAQRLDIRHVPEIDFVYDESIEYGMKIEEIIKEIHD